MAKAKKDKALELGSSALDFSRFGVDYEAARKEIEKELDERLQVEKQKSLERKKKFDELNGKYKEAYTEIVLAHALVILEKFGVKISTELTEVLKKESNIEKLNKTGNFKSVLEDEDNLLKDIETFLNEREDICLEVMTFVEQRNAEPVE